MVFIDIIDILSKIFKYKKYMVEIDRKIFFLV